MGNLDLLDKVIKVKDLFSDAVNIYTKPEREAEGFLIDYYKNMEISDPFEKAALISEVRTILKKYKNTHDILEVAKKYIHQDSAENEVDPDWIMQFNDSAKKISSEDFQIIWGRILASECNDPGSIPKNLLFVLERMDRISAENFVKICKTVVRIGTQYCPIIPFIKMDELKKYGITFDILVDAEAFGLIEVDSSYIANGYSVNFSAEEKPHEISYCQKKYQYNDDQDEVRIGSVIFTRTGESLYKFLLNNEIDGLGITELEGYWEEICLPQIKTGEQ